MAETLFVSTNEMHTNILSVARDCAAKAGLNINFRDESSDEWRKVLAELPYVPVAYTEAMIDYQLAYLSGPGAEVFDASMILLHDGRPAGVWPLTIRHLEQWRIGSSDGPVLPPLFIKGLSPRSVKTLVGACLDMLDALGAKLGGVRQSMEPFAAAQGLGEWHCRLMQRGARLLVGHDLFVDLSLDLAAIKSNFRKSYRALITSGGKLWQVNILRSADSAVWDEYRGLHVKAAGRITRSLESWRIQLDAIGQGNAFLVYLRDEAGAMVGGGLFYLSRDEGVYAVGAYDRSLFDKPLGHVVQFHAIQEMQARGPRWYKIGARAYPSDVPQPTEKELSISEFKEGFATHCFPRFIFSTG